MAFVWNSNFDRLSRSIHLSQKRIYLSHTWNCDICILLKISLSIWTSSNQPSNNSTIIRTIRWWRSARYISKYFVIPLNPVRNEPTTIIIHIKTTWFMKKYWKTTWITTHCIISSSSTWLRWLSIGAQGNWIGIWTPSTSSSRSLKYKSLKKIFEI